MSEPIPVDRVDETEEPSDPQPTDDVDGDWND